MVTETRRRGCDGIVCGHIHKPELRKIDGIIYANDGDWVESLSALVEHHDGRLELIEWQKLMCTTGSSQLGCKEALNQSKASIHRQKANLKQGA